jgi:hypothetical protein
MFLEAINDMYVIRKLILYRASQRYFNNNIYRTKTPALNGDQL